MARGENITRVECGLQRGEGWVERREREDGSIVFASRWYDGTGKDRKLQYYPHAHPEGADERDTIDQAADYNRSIARKKRRGVYTPLDRKTVDDLVAEYLRRGKMKWSSSTVYGHTTRLKTMIRPYIGDRLVLTLTSDELQDWIDRLKDDGYQPRSIHGAVAVMSGALRSARRLKIITDNPLEGVEIPMIARAEHSTWSVQEVTAVLEHVDSDPFWRALYRLALITGMRPGELLVLRWADIDLGTGSVRVARTKSTSEDGREIIGETTKTKRERRVPIDEGCVLALKALAASQFGDRLAPSDAQVFPGKTAKVLSETKWRRYQNAMVETLGITRITLHELRHTNASIEIAAGTNWVVVKDRLGHKQIQTTLDIYAHLTPVQHKDAAEALGQRLLQFPKRTPDTTTSTPDEPKTG